MARFIAITAPFIWPATFNNTVTNNIFVGGLNVAGAVTAIETHGGRQVVSRQHRDGYWIAVNECFRHSQIALWRAYILSVGYIIECLLRNHTLVKCYRSHTTGYGLVNATVSGDLISIWRRLIGDTDPVTGAALIGNASVWQSTRLPTWRLRRFLSSKQLNRIRFRVFA